MATPSDEHSDLDITALLHDVLTSLSEEEKRNLLDCLRRRRAHPRKLCIMPVEYRDGDGNCYHNFTLDISIGGVFIETCEPHAVGHKLLLLLSFPGRTEPFQVEGTVAWRGPNGVGVKFERLTEEQKETLSSIVHTL